MKKFKIGLLVILFIGLLSGFSQDGEKAELVVTNGKIFTFSAKHPEVQAVAVKDGKILALGTNKEIKKYIGSSTRVLNVRRKLVIPGFIDAHCHIGLSINIFRPEKIFITLGMVLERAVVLLLLGPVVFVPPEGSYGIFDGIAAFAGPFLANQLRDKRIQDHKHGMSFLSMPSISSLP